MTSDVPLPPEGLARTFGKIDIYLFDQLCRGRLTPDMRVLDAGCGGGRNLHYLLRAGFDVHAADRSAERVETVRAAARELSPSWSDERAVVAELADLPYPDGHFDAVICNAVLHFSETTEAFRRSLDGIWRVLAPGGMLWARLTSSIGIEERVRSLGDGRFRLPDGSDRFLVDEQQLLAHTERLGAELLDPIKTTNVQGLRCMTTWVVTRPR